MQIETNFLIFGASKAQYNKKSKKNNNKPIYYTAGALVLAAGVTTATILAGRKKPDKYLMELAQELSKELNKTVKPSDLESVMTKEEFLIEIQKLQKENFVASQKNIENGIFMADLHSHSNFSDGTLSIREFMEQAANYGDKLNQINGNKFIFALTDHDGIEGVKEALKIIAENPSKFKNVKFVPAAELSFVEHCSPNSSRFNKYHSDVQMPEMLIYNINPFSKETESFFENLYSKRKTQAEQMIIKANNENSGYNFSIEEYKQLVDRTHGRYYLLNQHWNIHDYLQLKTRLVDIAREKNMDEQKFFNETINALDEGKRTPGELTKYLNKKNIETTTPETYERITNLSKPFFPRSENGRAISDYDNTFDDIVDYARKEHAHLAFAHPGFTMQNFTKEESYEKIRSYIMRSKGTLRFSEKHHQAYPIGKEIEQKELDKYNDILDEFNLFNIGGRDNHSGKFI